LCKGYGTCVAACPSGSIKQNLFEDEKIFIEINGLLTFESELVYGGIL
jgi:heterodisulfide reductase subunit A